MTINFNVLGESKMPANLAIKYSSKLDQIWTHASYTDNWINKKYDFDGVYRGV